MQTSWRQAAGWYHAAALAALPWIAFWEPGWLPAGIVAVAAGAVVAGRGRSPQPWTGAVQVMSGLVALAMADRWQVALGWAVASVVVAGTRAALGAPRMRPDGGDAVAAVVWATPFALSPSLLGGGTTSAVAAAVVVIGAVGAALRSDAAARGGAAVLAPPSREVRGTVTLRGAVVGDRDGLRRTVPLELEVRAGESVAVLHDSEEDASAVAETLVGRRPPLAGEVAVDGVPFPAGDRLAAFVARGEPLLPGTLGDNLAALSDTPLGAGTLDAVCEACGLEDARRDLGGRRISADGSPLAPLDRALVLVARVVPSDYRVLVVLDPAPWVNSVRAELWRSAVVRASLGRTAIWWTTDVDLARRADRVLELRHGGLRPREM